MANEQQQTLKKNFNRVDGGQGKKKKRNKEVRRLKMGHRTQ
jgi:hypothetical protein